MHGMMPFLISCADTISQSTSRSNTTWRKGLMYNYKTLRRKVHIKEGQERLKETPIYIYIYITADEAHLRQYMHACMHAACCTHLYNTCEHSDI